MRLMMIGSTLSLVGSAAVAQDFGGQEDQDYAGQLWKACGNETWQVTALFRPSRIRGRIRTA